MHIITYCHSCEEPVREEREPRVPAALGLEHCLDAEAAGRLCRDAGPAGLAFFPNRFLA